MASTSTTPVAAKTIKITVTDGVKGQPITIRNRDNGDVIHTTLGDTAKAIVDLQNFDNEYTAGHVIDFIVSGEQVGSTSLTTAGNKAESVTISTTSITSGLARGI
jgi:hypothetical protein